jgi:hypothetical protein
MTDEFLTNLQNLTTFDARELHLHPALLHRQGNGVIQDWRAGADKRGKFAVQLPLHFQT